MRYCFREDDFKKCIEVIGILPYWLEYAALKCVYINSDGAGWIQATANYVGKSKLVADRLHLMKYINRVVRYTLEEETIAKGRFYKYIYKNKLLAAKKLLTGIKNHCERSNYAVEECRKYLLGNWEYIQRAFHDKHVLGGSAEGQVSSVYSERMSSRPMGWSETGTDRMCKLRCFIQNYGPKNDRSDGLSQKTGTVCSRSNRNG